MIIKIDWSNLLLESKTDCPLIQCWLVIVLKTQSTLNIRAKAMFMQLTPGFTLFFPQQ